MNYFKKGRKCGVPGAGRKKSAKTIEREEQARNLAVQKQLKAFENFENATSGSFNGFDFVELFHQKWNKINAVHVCVADDTATAITPFGTFKVAEDGMTCYFMTTLPTKKVVFNRSVYFV